MLIQRLILKGDKAITKLYALFSNFPNMEKIESFLQKLVFLTLKNKNKYIFLYFFFNFMLNYMTLIWIRISIAVLDPDPGTPKLRIRIRNHAYMSIPLSAYSSLMRQYL